jgi:CheY-like chemotaxis protein
VQVFANLLSNAAKYTPESGRIELRVAATPDSVVVVVKDEGEGIDPEMQHRIFDMFTQVKRPGKSSEGLGIGLTLVRLLVQKHRGSIEVASEGLGKGSEFIVTLPRAIHPEEGVEEPEPELEVAPVAAPARSRILVVDDGVSAADMLALFLKLEGYDSRTAYDGIEALEIASELQPRVVFLDIGMPRMDGYEAARRLRQLPGGQQMILIALTGWGQERDREKTRLAGFDHHLVKPVEPVTLRRLLAQLDLDEPRAVPAQITV